MRKLKKKRELSCTCENKDLSFAIERSNQSESRGKRYSENTRTFTKVLQVGRSLDQKRRVAKRCFAGYTASYHCVFHVNHTFPKTGRSYHEDNLGWSDSPPDRIAACRSFRGHNLCPQHRGPWLLHSVVFDKSVQLHNRKTCDIRAHNAHQAVRRSVLSDSRHHPDTHLSYRNHPNIHR